MRARAQQTVFVQEEEDEGVDDGDENACPQRDPKGGQTHTHWGKSSIKAMFETVKLCNKVNLLSSVTFFLES